MSENIAFCRMMLKVTLRDLKEAGITTESRKAAWVVRVDNRTLEFHVNRCTQFPDGFYWYGSADNSYHARALGWGKALERFQTPSGKTRRHAWDSWVIEGKMPASYYTCLTCNTTSKIKNAEACPGRAKK